MCRKHNPAHRHRHIIHSMSAMEMEEGFDTMVVPQVRECFPKGTVVAGPLSRRGSNRALAVCIMSHPRRAGSII